VTPDGAQELGMHLPPAGIVFKREPPLALELAYAHSHSLPPGFSSPHHLEHLFQIQMPHAQPAKARLDGPGGFRVRDEDGPDLGDVNLKQFLLTRLFSRLTLLCRGDLRASSG